MDKIAFFGMDVESFYDTGCVQKAGITDGARPCADGVSRFLDLTDKYGIKATLFITESFIPECEQELKRALGGGHELAVHCYRHVPPMLEDYDTFCDGINKTVNEIEEKFGVKPIGYRAPCFGINDRILSFIRESGFAYDSSALNFKRAIDSGGVDLGGFEKVNDVVYEKNGFFEFKPCSAKMFGKDVPISGGAYVRLMPWLYIKRKIDKYISASNSYMFYVHPFELCADKFTELNGLSTLEKTFVNRGKASYLGKIEYIIEKLINENYSFCTMAQFVERRNKK